MTEYTPNITPENYKQYVAPEIPEKPTHLQSQKINTEGDRLLLINDLKLKVLSRRQAIENNEDWDTESEIKGVIADVVEKSNLPKHVALGLASTFTALLVSSSIIGGAVLVKHKFKDLPK